MATPTQEQSVAAAPEPKRRAAESSDESLQAHRVRGFLRSFGACAVSMAFHIVLLVVLGLVVMPVVAHQPLASVIAELYEDDPEEEIFSIELDPDLEAATELTTEISPASLQMGITGADLGGMQPQLDTKVVDQLTELTVNVGPPDFVMPSQHKMIESVPDGARGDERFVTDNIDHALSQITQELIVMLEKGPVLVIWLFDRSDSMLDDRKYIRDQIDVVYEELGILGKTGNENLTTAVTSYGNVFTDNMGRRGPTSNLEEIRAAMDSVRIDKSGNEIMCEAVGRSINNYRQTAERQRRQMALILVTDESGEPENNDAFLERAIAEAKAAKCKIYALGREAAFGYPYIYFRWRDPSTKRLRPIPVDRGPETAFPEQLQIDGFRRRYDAFPSGFGPYVQTRMIHETGGVFFLLPTEEGAQIGRRRTRYELESMRSYKPDLRAKLEVVLDRDTFPTRRAIWKVVDDLNPLYNEQKRKEIELTVNFPLNAAQFLRVARENQVKARKLLHYLSDAERFLLDNQVYREQEVSPRWQANYDLMIAQLVTFQVRIYEYGIYLDWFMKNPPKDVPLVREKDRLDNWGIRRRRTTFAEDPQLWKDYPDREKVLQYIDRGKQMLRTVIKNHPGTPWAARAEWELSRGFGVYLVPEYDRPTPPGSRPSAKPKDPPVFQG